MHFIFHLAKSTIQSCLASAESLDTYLIPSMLSHQNRHHCQALQQHWLSEIACLQNEIQRIIDTSAFCNSFIDQLQWAIDNLLRNWDEQLIDKILEKSEILLEQFRINRNDLELNIADSQLRLNYDNFKIIIKECRAAAMNENATHDRILKRFKIMLSVIKKFKICIDQHTFISNEKQKIISGDVNNHCFVESTPKSRILSSNVVSSTEATLNEKYFEKFGISAASCSVFYQSGAAGTSKLSHRMRKKKGEVNAAGSLSTINWSPIKRVNKKRM